MATYSSYAFPIQSDNLNDISAILSQLPDNTTKLVSPKDVRDAVFTTWENIPFKFTKTPDSLLNFIGMDNNGGNSNLKYKMYFGKRKYGTVDIMTSALLGSNNSDFFFFNNRADNLQQNTKISILSGTISTLHINAPYIESVVVTGPTYTYSNLIIKNPSTIDNEHFGDVDISAGVNGGGTYSGGKVIINGLKFKNYVGLDLSSEDGKVLRYNNNTDSVELTEGDTIDNLYSTGTVSIVGSPVLINGSPILFSSPLDYMNVPIPVPFQVGGVLAGETFTDVSVVDMLKRILYPYIPPTVDIVMSVTPNNETSLTDTILFEYGNLSSIKYSYGINKMSDSITNITATNLSGFPGSGVGVITYPLNTSISANNLAINPSTMDFVNKKTFTLKVNDGTNEVQDAVTLEKVYPFFWGTSTGATSSTSGINALISDASLVNSQTVGLRKLVAEEFDERDLDFIGNNVCIYYMHPVQLGPLRVTNVPALTEIIFNNFNLIGSFDQYILNLSNEHWTNVPYVVYVYSQLGQPALTTIGTSSNDYKATYKIKH